MRISYWSSDVCSSDLVAAADRFERVGSHRDAAPGDGTAFGGVLRADVDHMRGAAFVEVSRSVRHRGCANQCGAEKARGASSARTDRKAPLPSSAPLTFFSAPGLPFLSTNPSDCDMALGGVKSATEA